MQSPNPRVIMYKIPSWRAQESAAAANRTRHAGASLFKHLLGLFDERKISAKDFAIACHWCHESKVPGADFVAYELAPGQSSDGAYQRYLDKSIPPMAPIYFLDAPCNIRGRGTRETRPIPTNPLHECIAREVRGDPSIMERAHRRPWPPMLQQSSPRAEGTRREFSPPSPAVPIFGRRSVHRTFGRAQRLDLGDLGVQRCHE